MYILNIAGLYASAGSVLILLFQYINLAFPDVLNPYYDSGDPIRWALASIIIIFPVFLWASRFLQKDIVANPQKSELKIRKWLLYFTIFAAGALIIGDLVSLVYNFLQGEITFRFILKIISVLIVAAAVFGYYLYDLHRKPEEFSKNMKIFIWSVIVVVIIIVATGFFMAGSPFKQRLIRFDREKVNNLQEIQGQVVNYWIQKGFLPQSLNDLKDSISGFTLPKDPQTTEPYVYKLTGKFSFELCANFNLSYDYGKIGSLQPSGPLGRAEDNWSHAAGNVCFSRIIDPELYKPKKD